MNHARTSALIERAASLLLLVLLAVQPCSAQQDPQADPPQAGEQTTAGDKQPPSLDDLLGLEEEETDDAAARDDEQELQQLLNEQEVRGAFESALEKMTLSADLLDQEFDTGLGTQRTQQEILAKLASLVDDAMKRQGQCSGQGQSTSKKPSQSQNPGKKSGSGGGNEGGTTNTGESVERDPPPGRDADPNAAFEESRTEWGSLPQRVRDMLLQGRREKFSSLYEQLTREYYRRLAEEGSS